MEQESLQIYDPNTENPQILGESKTSSDDTDTMVGALSTSCRGRKRKKTVQLKPSVCFACKDTAGGRLINCTRKGCSKAYHIACTGRKHKFFINNKSWQCSSHICIKCEKASHHSCYTCTYSLCEGCNKELDFLHISGCKGFCKICTERVTTIEKNEQGNECKKELKLFRDYWISVRKSKGLIEAINRLKGQHDKLDHTDKTGSSSEHLEVSSSKRRKLSRCSELSVLEGSSGEARMGHEEGVSMFCEEEWASKELLDFVRYMKNGDTSALSHFSVKALLLEYIKRNNLRDPCQQTRILCDSRLENLFGKACIRHFEMFCYLRTHLLKNDRQACPIQAGSSDMGPSQMGIGGIINPQKVLVADKIGEICKNSGHALSKIDKDDCAATAVRLETKDVSNPPEKPDADKGVKIRQVSEDKSPHTILDYAAIDTQLETGDNSKPLREADADKGVKLCNLGCVSIDTQLTSGDFSKVTRKVGAYKRPNIHIKGEHRSLQTNLDEYASIDVHNINLLYLRRNLLEDVLEDINNFHDKIVGSFVRITVESCGKQETHRLVEVVGTGKAPHPCETCAKTTKVILEILNLGKTEMVPIVDLSNEDFSEEECKCLRENMKCGLVKQMTMREVQEKAMDLQKMRAYLLGKEKQSLCSRRDFLSEKGQRKQHRECVKSLQLLEERLHRVQEVPDIHADPDLAPNDKSQEDADSDDKGQDNYTGHTEIVFCSEGKNPKSPGKGFLVSNDSCTGERKNSPTALKSGESAVAKCVWDIGDIANGPCERIHGSSWNRDREVRDPVAACALDTGTLNGQILAGSGSSDESATASFASETEELWHYHDPSGKIQGPFSMLQLCKWSTTSSFPANMRIWRKTEMQEDPILLTDALNNTFSTPKVAASYESKRGNKAGTVSQSCQLTLSSTTEPIPLKPMDELNASGVLCTTESNMSKPMAIQSARDFPTDHDSVTSSSGLPFARDLFQGPNNYLSSLQQSPSPNLSAQMVIQSALDLPRVHDTELGTSAGDLFQISKNELPSSQQAVSPNVIAGDCTVASQSESLGMAFQSTWTDDLTGSQADGSEKETEAVGSKEDGETRHHDILTNVSAETLDFVAEFPQSAIHGALIDVKDSVNPPAELAGANIVKLSENHRCNSSDQESERDLKFGSESAPVQNQETRGPATETMNMGWETAAEGNKASNQETWETQIANNGWDEQAKSHGCDGNFSGSWGEPERDSPKLKKHQNEVRSSVNDGNFSSGWGEHAEDAGWLRRCTANGGDRSSDCQNSTYKGNVNKGRGDEAGNAWDRQWRDNGSRVTGHQNRSHQGNDFGDRSCSSPWNRQSDLVAGNQRGSSGRLLCVYHKNGYCWNGDSCRFSHDEDGNQGGSFGTPLCKYHKYDGYCNNGESCPFSHVEGTGRW